MCLNHNALIIKYAFSLASTYLGVGCRQGKLFPVEKGLVVLGKSFYQNLILTIKTLHYNLVCASFIKVKLQVKSIASCCNLSLSINT